MPTTRDTVWSTVLKLAYENQQNDERSGFTVKDILAEAGMDESQKRTVVRTLRSMEELGWIQHTDNSPIYRFQNDVHFGRSDWTRSKEDERRLRKLSIDLGYPNGLPFEMILDAVEDRLKDEAVQQWREQID